MGDYQFGPHIKIKEVLKNEKYYAKIFSEGNKQLELLLLKLWEYGIETYMCCTGHEWGDTPYIMMYVPLDKINIAYDIINCVYNDPTIMIKLGREFINDGILIDIRSYVKSDFFKTINDYLNDMKIKTEGNDVINSALKLLTNFDYDNYDLYWQIVNYEENKKHNLFLNYTSVGPNGPTRHMYVLNKIVKESEIGGILNLFSEEELLKNVNKYSGSNKLIKKK